MTAHTEELEELLGVGPNRDQCVARGTRGQRLKQKMALLQHWRPLASFVDSGRGGKGTRRAAGDRRGFPERRGGGGGGFGSRDRTTILPRLC